MQFVSHSKYITKKSGVSLSLFFKKRYKFNINLAYSLKSKPLNLTHIYKSESIKYINHLHYGASGIVLPA